MKFLLLPLLLVASCLLAGLYGAVHNQISYTVAPEYFHAFKFYQFGIDDVLRNRLGASLVGWSASWWMGIFVGIPIYIVGLFITENSVFIRAYVKSAIVVVLLTLLIGLVTLAISFFTVSVENVVVSARLAGLDDPVAFTRAGTMHNFSYLGAFFGMLAGLGFMMRAAILSRRGNSDDAIDHSTDQ